MSLTLWDQISRILSEIEYNAERANHYAAMTARYASHLKGVPDFETRAADALERAETELRTALASVKAAREQYQQKPLLAAAE